MRWSDMGSRGPSRMRPSSQILCKLLIRRMGQHHLTACKVLGTFHEIEVSLVENVFTCRIRQLKLEVFMYRLKAMARVAFRP
jgi:hypothetical protein